jgi:hypothetical protein
MNVTETAIEKGTKTVIGTVTIAVATIDVRLIKNGLPSIVALLVLAE